MAIKPAETDPEEKKVKYDPGRKVFRTKAYVEDRTETEKWLSVYFSFHHKKALTRKLGLCCNLQPRGR